MLPVQIQGWKRGRSDAPSHRQTRHISPEKKEIEINFTVYFNFLKDKNNINERT